MQGSSVGPLTGQLVADNNTVALNHFNASLFGGTAAGDAVIAMAKGGASKLTATLNNLNTNDLFKLAQVNNAPLAGKINGAVKLGWPGTNFDADRRRRPKASSLSPAMLMFRRKAGCSTSINSRLRPT